VDDDLDDFRHELAVDLVAPYELARRAARWWIDNDQHQTCRPSENMK